MDTTDPKIIRLACLQAHYEHAERVRDRLWTVAQVFCAVSVSVDMLMHGHWASKGLWIVTVVLVILAWRASGKAAKLYQQRLDSHLA